ncbi:putative sodium-dependent multivitamin transporter isoform X3 [Bacillus rossius redtenbacheri]|uniref:putative sodium-dependent multivitamin transporter isoform X3 n=1 Tax=Bacillus rossius redtenbacheri TaxID=93214 RepID=UPI002FDD9099
MIKFALTLSQFPSGLEQLTVTFSSCRSRAFSCGQASSHGRVSSHGRAYSWGDEHGAGVWRLGLRGGGTDDGGVGGHRLVLPLLGRSAEECAGVPAGGPGPARAAGRHLAHGLLHVVHHPAGRQPRELHLRHAVRRHQRGLRPHHARHHALLPARLLQAAADQLLPVPGGALRSDDEAAHVGGLHPADGAVPQHRAVRPGHSAGGPDGHLHGVCHPAGRPRLHLLLHHRRHQGRRLHRLLPAVFAVIIKGAMDAGGLKEIWRIAGEGGRLQFDNVSADPTQRHTWWSLMLGGGFTYLSLYAVNQIQVQRLLTLRSIQRSQVALWLSWPILSLISLSTSLAGLAIYSRYHDCDPVAAGRITSTDQLMPLFVVDSMGGLPGLCGVFVAGIFSGSLSTISSGVNSLAAVTLEDYIKPVYKRVKAREIPEKMNNIILKSFALAYGLVSVALAFSADYLGGLLQASLSILGVVGGPTLGMFTLGMFFTITNETGAVCGLLTGLSIAFWIAFGGPKPPVITLPISTEGCTNQPNVSDAGSSAELYRQSDTIFNTSVSQLVSNESSDSNYFYLYKLSYLWYVVIGFLMTVVVGLLVSAVCKMFRKTEPPAPNPDLFIPCVRSYILRQMAKKQLDGATKQYAAMDKLGPTAVSSESLKSGESAPL